MQDSLAKRSIPKHPFIFLLILFIISDVIADNYIFGVFGSQSPIREVFLFIGMLVLQIIFSPIQAGLSDTYGRRKSLIISLSVSLFSIGMVFLYASQVASLFLLLIVANLAKGIFGNTIPISWAAIGEITQRDARFSFALSTAAYAVGYLFLLVVEKYFPVNKSILIFFVVFFGVLYVCVKWFRDVRDEECRPKKHSRDSIGTLVLKEFYLVLEDLKGPRIRFILLAAFFWEISLYTILLLYADFGDSKNSLTGILMMSGYLFGTFLMKFCRKFTDHTMMMSGFAVSGFSVILYFFLLFSVNDINYVLGISYFFHAIGNAFLSPTLLSLISKEREPHERGKIFGLVESADTFSFLIASVIIIFYKNSMINLYTLIYFSFITIVISWIPYRHYEKIRRKIS